MYAKIVFVVCPRCGMVAAHLTTEPPAEECALCGRRLSRHGRWLSEVKIFKMGEGRRREEESARVAEEFFKKRNGVVKFRMRDGRECTVRMRDYPYYEVEVEAGGEPAKMIFIQNEVLNAVKMLKAEGKIYMPGLIAIEAGGCRYPNTHHMIKVLAKAIEEDEKPSIVAMIE